MFNERKVAHMAVFFLARAGGQVSHLKLMKLLYLAERESIKQYCIPMCGDDLVAMAHGPVLSKTLDLMDGDVKSQNDGWDKWVSTKANHQLYWVNKIELDQLDELSKADIGILGSTWEKFGSMGQWEIRDYTHVHCPEWKDPKGSSRLISYENLLEALGRSPKEARLIAKKIREENAIDSNFSE